MKKEKLVPIDKLVITNPILDKDKIKRISRMPIEQIINLGEICVAECSSSDDLYVLDGSHRVSVLKKLKVGRIRVSVVYAYEDDPRESNEFVMSY